MAITDPYHRSISHNAPVPYPTMHQFVTEICIPVHICATSWYIMGYLPEALWDSWDRSIAFNCTLSSYIAKIFLSIPYHIEAEKNLPSFRRWHFQMHFSRIKMNKFRLRLNLNFFLWFKLTIFQRCFAQWLDAHQATNHYLTQICITRPQWVMRPKCREPIVSLSIMEDWHFLVLIMIV